MKLIQHQSKKFNLITICSILLIITYFLPWIFFDFNGIQLTGMSIGASLPKLDFLKANLQFDDISFLKVAYLLWAIPILSIIHIIADITGIKGWLLRLDFIAGIIAAIVTYSIVQYMDGTGPQYLKYGFHLSAAVSVLGLLFQILGYIWGKKN